MMGQTPHFMGWAEGGFLGTLLPPVYLPLGQMKWISSER